MSGGVSAASSSASSPSRVWATSKSSRSKCHLSRSVERGVVLDQQQLPIHHPARPPAFGARGVCGRFGDRDVTDSVTATAASPRNKGQSLFPGRLRTVPISTLRPPAEGVEQGLGIAVGLGGAFEDQGAGGLEGEAGLLVARHRPVERVARILGVDAARPCGGAPRPPPRPCRRRAAASWRYAARRCARWRGPPSGRHRGCRAPWSSRRPDRSSARHSPVCPGHCCRARRGSPPASSCAPPPAAR